MRSVFAWLALLLVLSGCSGVVEERKGAKLTDVSERFCKAMRWGDYIGAGNFVRKDLRQEFIDLFQQQEELRISDSRIISILPREGYTEAVYQMEYYYLSSMRLQKWQWRQQWTYEQFDGLKFGLWMIDNLPPEFP